MRLNSISGVRALACASRTCRALASPYFFKPLKCGFKELVLQDRIAGAPVITLSVADNFKTVKLHNEPQPGQDDLVNIGQILSVENCYECLEYLPDRSAYYFNLSVSALDLLNQTLPLLSRLVIDLDEFVGYSTSWDQAYKSLNKRSLYTPLSYIDGLDLICAIARFQNLRHLTIYFKLQHDQVSLMHPRPGCVAVRELFDSIQERKRGQALVQLDVIFYTYSSTIFGYVNRSWDFERPTVSTTMTVTCDSGAFPQGDRRAQYSCNCTNTSFGKVIERRRRIERLYGEPVWAYRLGSVQRNLLQGTYSKLPWYIIMESLLCLALLPSYFIFDEGKRVRFEPTLANMGTGYHKDGLKRGFRFKERLFSRLLACR